MPNSNALSGKSSSHTVKQNFDIAGILERNGNILAPAGMIWSVVILSPTFSEHFASMLSASGTVVGNGFIFGPLKISMLSISFSSAGATTMLSFIRKVSGSLISGISPISLGSVNTPVKAEIAAISGDTR